MNYSDLMDVVMHTAMNKKKKKLINFKSDGMVHGIQLIVLLSKYPPRKLP